MSPERFSNLMETATLIGFGIVGFVAVGLIAMIVTAYYYNKKGE